MGVGVYENKRERMVDPTSREPLASGRENKDVSIVHFVILFDTFKILYFR
jgi:hypothetical protein